jgi:hypothetical protein
LRSESRSKSGSDDSPRVRIRAIRSPGLYDGEVAGMDVRKHGGKERGQARTVMRDVE